MISPAIYTDILTIIIFAVLALVLIGSAALLIAAPIAVIVGIIFLIKKAVSKKNNRTKVKSEE